MRSPPARVHPRLRHFAGCVRPSRRGPLRVIRGEPGRRRRNQLEGRIRDWRRVGLFATPETTGSIRFACPGAPLYTAGRPSESALAQSTSVQRPSPQPALTATDGSSLQQGILRHRVAHSVRRFVRRADDGCTPARQPSPRASRRLQILRACRRPTPPGQTLRPAGAAVALGVLHQLNWTQPLLQARPRCSA